MSFSIIALNPFQIVLYSWVLVLSLTTLPLCFSDCSWSLWLWFCVCTFEEVGSYFHCPKVPFSVAAHSARSVCLSDKLSVAKFVPDTWVTKVNLMPGSMLLSLEFWMQEHWPIDCVWSSRLRAYVHGFPQIGAWGLGPQGLLSTRVSLEFESTEASQAFAWYLVCWHAPKSCQWDLA